MKNYALFFMSLFTVLLLIGTVMLMLNDNVIGGLVIVASSLGATVSLLLYDNERLFSPGSIAKYKWQDDIIKLSTIIGCGCLCIFFLL